MIDTSNFNPYKSLLLTQYVMKEQNIEYIGGMFPKGKVSALIGCSGIGKSWTLIGASLSITTNKLFLPLENYNTYDNKGVLIVETEGRIRTYVERLNMLEANLHNYTTPTGFNYICRFNNPKDRQLIEDVIEADKHELVIIDSFAAFSSVDENTCQVMDCLNWLIEIALKYDIAVVFTQLANKVETAGKLSSKSTRGFSGIIQIPELIWAIDEPQKDVKRLYQVKNNITKLDQNEYLFQIKDNDIEFEIKNGTSRLDLYNGNKSKSDIEILEILKQHEPFVSVDTLKKWLQRKRTR